MVSYFAVVKRVFLMLFGCLFALSLRGQVAAGSYFNSEEFWTAVVMVDDPHFENYRSIDVASDTLVAVVTNRVIVPGRIRFALEESTDTLSYFIASKRESVWLLYPFASFKEMMTAFSAKKNLVVYTEGFGKVFTSGVDRGLKLSMQYDVAVLYLDYPSYKSNYGMSKNWKLVHTEARKAGIAFNPVLDSLYTYRAQLLFTHYTLFYHSMGNLALMEAMLHHPNSLWNSSRWVDNVLLNAACVPAKSVKKWLGNIQFAHQVLIHYNPNDRTLKLAQLRSGNRKLGQGPHMVAPPNGNIYWVNFEARVAKEHSYFLDFPGRVTVSPIVKSYFKHVFQGKSIRELSICRFKIESSGNNYTFFSEKATPF